MGYKGFVRSVNSTLKQIERDNRRRQKELERELKLQAKLEELEFAKLTVENYENNIELIQTMHKECNPTIDWNIVKNTLKPEEPLADNNNEDKAKSALDNYKPNIFNKLFNQYEKKRNLLLENITEGKNADEKIHNDNLKVYETDVDDWKNSVSIAGKVLVGDTEAYLDVIKEMSPFQEFDHLGTNINFTFPNKDFAEIVLTVHGEKVVPSEVKSLLKTGKLSTKNMPIGQFNEVYQDHICSSVLRVSREIYALLPINKLVVNASSELLNTATGYKEESVILSAFIPKENLENINFDEIDPSDSMGNFVNNMDFKRTKGMFAVEKVDLKKYI